MSTVVDFSRRLFTLEAVKCSATNKDGSPCKRSAAPESNVCHLHARAARAKAAKTGTIVRFPLQEGVRAYQYDPAELGAWLRQVRLGEISITQEKVLGGSGEVVSVELHPDFADRLQAAALEHRVGAGITEEPQVSGAELADAIRTALKTM
jgi:hypothetical protein